MTKLENLNCERRNLKKEVEKKYINLKTQLATILKKLNQNKTQKLKL